MYFTEYIIVANQHWNETHCHAAVSYHSLLECHASHPTANGSLLLGGLRTVGTRLMITEAREASHQSLDNGSLVMHLIWAWLCPVCSAPALFGTDWLVAHKLKLAILPGQLGPEEPHAPRASGLSRDIPFAYQLPKSGLRQKP